jgi:2-dehydro-3-deoxyphosphogluconate aldolase/(4S)-4-hydroxy-2-oxoglutarate aldolase
MSQRLETLEQLEATGVIAVIRANSGAEVLDICRALVAGGIRACEITLTTPGAVDAIAAVGRALGDAALVGAGSVLEVAQAEAAIDAGARFVFSSVLDPAVIELVRRRECVSVPGALTPTEIHAAVRAGADLVKVFPANHFGPQYFRDLRGPMPTLRLTPTGGVDLNTTAAWFKAGAVAVGVGSSLVKKDLIAARDWSGLSALAEQYVRLVAEARG